MSRSEIAALACRLLALAMFAVAAATVARLLAEGLADPGQSWISYLATTGLLMFVAGGVWSLVGIYFWQRADELALRMVDNDPEPVTSLNFTADDVLAAGCRILGLVLLMVALRTASEFAARFLAFSAELEEDSLAESYTRAAATEAALQAAIAVWFLVGTRGIVRSIGWARRAGSDEFEPGDDVAELTARPPSAAADTQGPDPQDVDAQDVDPQEAGPESGNTDRAKPTGETPP